MLELDPKAAALAKKKRSYLYNTRDIPRLRLLGFTFIIAVIAGYRVFLVGHVDQWVMILASAIWTYCLVSWWMLRVLSGRIGGAFDLGEAFMAADVVAYTMCIYFTGGEQSWLWILLIIHVADQTSAGFKRTLIFAHWNTLCYVTMLMVCAQTGQEVFWPTGVVKAVTLYAVNLYLCFTSQTADRLRQRTTEAVRLTQDMATELRAAHSELESLLRRHMLLLDSTEEGFYTVDLKGCATMANRAAAQMLGYKVEEMLGHNMHELIHYAHADGTPYPMNECSMLRAFEAGKTQSNLQEVYWRKSGESFPIEFSGAPVYDKGVLVGAVVTFRDITKRRELERLKDEFLSVVSHELRTPLTSIRGSLGLLAGGALGAIPPKGQRMLDIAVTNVERLIRLINDILDVERLTSGEINLCRQECDAADLVRTAVEGVRGVAEKAEVTLALQPVSVKLLADVDRIVQTLTNLLGNAIKFSPAGSTITLSVEPRAHEAVFAVRDRGRGIPKDKLSLIFDRFHQVDASDSREKGGTGLGLAICRSIVQQHGGQIWVESQPGEGSTFYFSLPENHPNSSAV